MSPDAEVLPVGSGDRLADAIEAAEDEPKTEAPKRERGKASPGRSRRTKEEIAEDEAADAADAAKAAPATAPNISAAPENRIDPASAADEAQDAADEAAEAEATKPAVLTHDDVRAALKRYVDGYGMAAALEDGPKVLGMLFGAGVSKVSEVPDTQDALGKAVAGIQEMLTKNPFKREAVL